MNAKRILLSPATVILIGIMIVGLLLIICGQSELGIPMVTFIPCVALFICCLPALAYRPAWKHVVILLLGTGAMIFVAYVTLGEGDPDRNHAGFWVLESLVILGISGLIYASRSRMEKSAKEGGIYQASRGARRDKEKDG